MTNNIQHHSVITHNTKKRLKWIRISTSTLKEMTEAETKYLKSLKPGNANFLSRFWTTCCGYITTCCLSPAASVIYWKHFKTDHLFQLIILIQKTNLNKNNEFRQRQWRTFLSVLCCDYTWQRHKLKRKNSEDAAEKKRQRKANWTTAKERGGAVADNGDTQLSKHEGEEKRKKNKLRRGESDTRNSWRLRKEKDKNMLKKMVKPLSLESINHKNPAVSP